MREQVREIAKSSESRLESERRGARLGRKKCGGKKVRDVIYSGLYMAS